MQDNFITKLLNLKGVRVTKFRNREHRIRIHIELPVREHTCPCCHCKTTKIHDYRFQLIKDIPMYYNKDTFIYYRKRRYVCTNCGKKFYEKNTFLPKRARKTNRLTAFIIQQLKGKQSIKDVAKTYFPKAKIVADRLHYARYIVQAVDTVRKKVQNMLTPEERRYFKHSRKLLLSKREKLNKIQQEELDYILINYSEELRRVYNEKEELLDIVHSKQKYQAIDRLNKWVKYNLEANYEVLIDCAKTYSNWIEEIRNSLLVPYSNGVMEGYNNKIKVLKRVAFGFRNFQNFKARILLME